jgi:hypothetical protein
LSPGEERIRAAEVIASLCLATDLGMGFLFEHGLHATLTTMRLCDAASRKVLSSVQGVTTQQTHNRSPNGLGGSLVRGRLASAAFGSLGLSAVVVVTAVGDTTALGAPRYWPWLLTGLQVVALWSAGTERWWGWLLGGSVQLPWIAYAVVTAQWGFVPGCAISASVQIHNFVRGGMPAAGFPNARTVLTPSTTRPTEVIA